MGGAAQQRAVSRCPAQPSSAPRVLVFRKTLCMAETRCSSWMLKAWNCGWSGTAGSWAVGGPSSAPWSPASSLWVFTCAVLPEGGHTWGPLSRALPWTGLTQGSPPRVLAESSACTAPPPTHPGRSLCGLSRGVRTGLGGQEPEGLCGAGAGRLAEPVEPGGSRRDVGMAKGPPSPGEQQEAVPRRPGAAALHHQEWSPGAGGL